MAGILPPLWSTLKTNIVTELEDVATAEKAIDVGRDFIVQKDRWRPWIEAQQNIPLVNIMIQNVGQVSERSANRRSTLDEVTVNVDMYALSEAGNVLPADQLAADRLDLLVAQVREGLTLLNTNDFGFTFDNDDGFVIDRNLNFSLTYYDQQNEQATGQYAPARWSFNVNMPFIPNDKRVYNDLEELNVDLEKYALRFTYTP